MFITVLMAIIAINENNKCPDNKVIKDHVNKKLFCYVEEELIEGSILELLDHNIIENRLTSMGNSYFIPSQSPK